MDQGGLCAKCYQRQKNTIAPLQVTESPFEKLLKSPASELTDRQKRDQLAGSVWLGNENRIDELLSGNTDFLNKAPSSAETWLGVAIARNCQENVLNRLLQCGCDPNTGTKSPDNTRPLEIAVQNDRIDAAEWLIKHGADPNLGRPIISAISFRKPAEVQLNLLKLLIAAGADLNQTFDRFGDPEDRFTALDHALLYDTSPKVIDFLKANGAKQHMSNEQISKLKKELKPRPIV